MEQQQIPCGNDRQKSKNKGRSKSNRGVVFAVSHPSDTNKCAARMGTRFLCECRFRRRVSGYGDDADVVFLAEGLGGVGDPGG